MSTRRIHAYIQLIIVAAIWGIAGPVIKYTLGYFTPFVFLLYRFAMMSVILVPIAILTKQRLPKSIKTLGVLFLAGLFASTINLGLLFYGIKFTTILDQSIISATAPVMVIIASTLFLHDRVTKKEWFGASIAFFGTLFVVIQPLLESIKTYQINILGNVLVLVSNLAWVATIIFSKVALRDKVSPMMITTTTFFIGLVTIIPAALKEVGGIEQIMVQVKSSPISGHLGVAYMALISGALAYYLYQNGQKSIEASEATLFSYLQAVFAIPLAIIWLKETITIPYIVGSVIVALGVFIAEYKKRQRLSSH